MGKAPTAEELLADPVVQSALEAAWKDSLADDPLRRHEEGGWIYCEVATRRISVRRVKSALRANIVLASPPKLFGHVVVGMFHTHPNPASEGWNTGPSPSDRQIADTFGVPNLIRAEDGDHWAGPTSRRGGLTGWAGFPAQERLGE